ncbi:nuclear transport factor 2 family protein [Pseudomonas sp. SA3-5]|uniref:Nuclear transport factor 2 family protein n=1 Tax=Pseudomonas aestuarii TaxID=3018340 RepID=A0ABT4XGE6_9PSED|nr:nuclear transport factor 2 family protein [Pseudomonas aestuarii]MDA7087262.1 nuclear transport factor 2 family protein [Pseudomonas aestuarii]
MTATELVHAYYAAFNAGDMPAFLELLSDEVVHDINQGERQVGKATFAAFMGKMNRCYRERLSDIVVLQNREGNRAAAEFVVHGEYLADDAGLPPANGQTYVLPAGAFFEIDGGKLTRISNYYNLNDWIAQVG